MTRRRDLAGAVPSFGAPSKSFHSSSFTPPLFVLRTSHGALELGAALDRPFQFFRLVRTFPEVARHTQSVAALGTLLIQESFRRPIGSRFRWGVG
jgi:hypothetical protein